MKRIILTALIACLAVGTAAAQSCDSKAVGANGKPLHGAAKMSFVKKCKRDACEGKAVSAEGKPLHGAAQLGVLGAPKSDGNGSFTRVFEILEWGETLRFAGKEDPFSLSDARWRSVAQVLRNG